MIFFSRKKDEKKPAAPKGEKKAPTKGERLDKGQLYCRIIIEMLGKPKSHVDKTFNAFIEQFAKEDDVTVVKRMYSKTKKQGELFTRFAEIEFWAESLSTIIAICFDYMPSSVEVLEPETVVFPVSQLNAYLNELQGKLHHVDMVAKNAETEKAILGNNLFKMTENCVLLSLATGAKAESEISRYTGISTENLSKITGSLLQKKKITKQGDKYALLR
jgi:hypothetical protein